VNVGHCDKSGTLRKVTEPIKPDARNGSAAEKSTLMALASVIQVPPLDDQDVLLEMHMVF